MFRLCNQKQEARLYHCEVKANSLLLTKTNWYIWWSTYLYTTRINTSKCIVTSSTNQLTEETNPNKLDGYTKRVFGSAVERIDFGIIDYDKSELEVNWFMFG
jgi:hypothetical protein